MPSKCLIQFASTRVKVTSIVLCMICYDLYKSSRATILSFEGGPSILTIVVLLALFSLLGLLLFPYLPVLAMFRKSPAMTKTRRYSFGPTGITIRSDDATSDCKWSLFERAVEAPNVFVLSLTKYRRIYIPKRCFAFPLVSRKFVILFMKICLGDGGCDVHEAIVHVFG